MSFEAVYVDFDDVLCETAHVFLRVLEREFDRRVEFEDIFAFDLARSFDLSRSEVDRLMQLSHTPAVLGGAEPLPGVFEALRRWTSAGCEIAVVTGRPPATEPICVEWLARHSVPHSRLLFVDKYGWSNPSVDGVEVLTLSALSAMEFALAIEDSPDMIAYLAQNTSIPIAILDRPWNASFPETEARWKGRVARCRGWAEILELFPDPRTLRASGRSATATNSGA